MCLDTVCSDYKNNNDGTSDNAAKIYSDIEASGVHVYISQLCIARHLRIRAQMSAVDTAYAGFVV